MSKIDSSEGGNLLGHIARDAYELGRIDGYTKGYVIGYGDGQNSSERLYTSDLNMVAGNVVGSPVPFDMVDAPIPISRAMAEMPVTSDMIEAPIPISRAMADSPPPEIVYEYVLESGLVDDGTDLSDPRLWDRDYNECFQPGYKSDNYCVSTLWFPDEY